jgi:hypothetical protein
VGGARPGATTRYLLSRDALELAADSRRIVWTEAAAGEDSTLLAWRPGEPSSVPLHTIPGRARHLRMWAGLVTWEQPTGDGDAWGYDFTTGTARPLAAGPGRQTQAVLVDETLAWADDRSGRWELRLRPLVR